ncbi:MAG: pentapeptide repeat-containing protein [Phototrophicaceae bacterium]
MAQTTLDERFAQNRKAWTFSPIQTFGIFLLTIAAIIALWGYWSEHETFTMANLLADFYANVSSELASVVITILVLDRLNERRAKDDRKLELFRKAKSRANDTAIEAVEQIRYENAWDAFFEHYRDDTNDVDLTAVQWMGSDLSQANLNEVDLYRANLQQAYLKEARLQAANLTRAKLQQATLWDTNLQDAILRDANLLNAKYIETTIFNAQTILPDGSQWTPEPDMTRYTNPVHPDFWEPDWVKRQRDRDGLE